MAEADTEATALLARQAQLESRSIEDGRVRYWKKIAAAEEAGRSSQEGAMRYLFLHAIEPIERGIQAMLDIEKGRRGAKHTASKWCEAVGPDVAAYLTAQVVLSALESSDPPTLMRMAQAISQRIIDELRFRRLKEKAPALFEYRMAKFTTTSYVHRARSLQASALYVGMPAGDLDMSDEQRAKLGTKLIDIMRETTGLLDVVMVKMPTRGRSAPKTQAQLRPTEDCKEFLKKRNSARELLFPIALPMVCQPLAWGPGQSGGYMFAMRGKLQLVRGISKAQTIAMAEVHMPKVYAALNALQNTAWLINRGILKVVEAVVGAGGGMAGVPLTDDSPMPPKPFDIATDKESRNAWKQKAGKMKDANHQRWLDTLAFGKVLGMAQELENDGAIFFPWTLDFRGRMYPASHHLQPQGGDMCRGLLTFAEGRPMGPDGGDWLAVHGANCMDTTPQGEKLTRLSRADRISWVQRNTLELAACASEPLDSRLWMQAEKPWQFLAFCIEWARFVESGMSQDFVSSLPIGIDGSNNGLQHLAAMLRDERSGHAVNLIPTDTPQDIYTSVLDKVLDLLEARAVTNDVAAAWLGTGVVNRKLVKRPAMTFSYGSKRYGFSEQIVEHVKSLPKEEQARVRTAFTSAETGKLELKTASNYLAGLIWDALGEIVVAAFAGMGWMQGAAKAVVNATEKPISWMIPLTGFTVRQDYFVPSRRQVKTILAGKCFKPSVYRATDQVLKRKQVNAISPNFVHSLDAAALAMAVGLSTASGVSSVSAVHDSFSTVAGDMTLLALSTRQAFMILHEDNPMASLHAQLVLAAPTAKVPAPPALGGLDLSQMLFSEYLFA